MLEAVKKALAIAQLLAGLIPVIRELITAIEVPGNGALKAEAVIQIVKATWSVVPEEARKLLSFDALESVVKVAISPIVAVLNAAGILPKSQG